MKIFSNISKCYSSLSSLLRGPKPLFLIPLALLAFTSCVDETLSECDPNRPGSEQFNEDDYVLRFKINLPSLGNGSRSTRTGEYDELDESYEDYIDPAKLHVFFFLKVNSDNNAIVSYDQPGTYRLYRHFSPTNPEFSLIPAMYSDHVNTSSKDWYVSISIPKMSDGEEFAKTLRNCDFKIAVIANASDNPVFYMSDGPYEITVKEKFEDEGESEGEGGNEDETGNGEEGEPEGVDESGDEDDDENESGNTTNEPGTYTITLYGDINMLHHQTSVDPYTGSAIYDFLYKINNPNNPNSKVLGFYTDWVKQRVKIPDATNTVSTNTDDIDTEVAKWIKEKWDPDNYSIDGLGTKYKELWFLWNFGGAFDNNALSYKIEGTEDAWQKRNAKFLKVILGEASAPSPEIHSISSFTTKIYDEEEGSFKDDSFPLTFTNFTEGKVAKRVEVGSADGKYYYGITLSAHPNGYGVNGNTYSRFLTNDKGCFSFEAPASGHLNITAKPNDGTSTRIIAQISNTNNYREFNFDGSNPITVSQEIKITSGTKTNTIYIYIDGNGNTNDADIFQIEYIQDTYLDETNRMGIAPSEHQPIPMYGTQKYKRLGGLWKHGASFDLDDYNEVSPDFEGANSSNTYFHPLPLLRSVAKVEILIPKKFNPEHVFLRSMNRYARWEPSDVESNTDDIWADNHDSFEEAEHSRYCEFYHIMEQKPFYDPDAGNQLTDYQAKLAWYYGNWGTLQGVSPVGHGNGNSNLACIKPDFTYPHIMNPLIYRSDFVEFLHVGSTETYERYVLYVPEKFVDDPESIEDVNNIEKSAPMVCHIEFRTSEDLATNYDDDNCYRVYFIKDGYNKTKVPNLSDENNSWEKIYEQDIENLQKHWPILRNHYYRFTVQELTPAIVVDLKVLAWRKNDISVDWW